MYPGQPKFDHFLDILPFSEYTNDKIVVQYTLTLSIIELLFVFDRDFAMPTLKDVARKAEVSIKTVSRVINNEAGVSEETRARVRQVASELGYVPDLSAQRLKRGKSGLIALLLPRIESPYAAKLLSSVLSETAEPWILHACTQG